MVATDHLRTIHAMSATEPQPRTRIRISHSRTQRDGWQFDSTVEVEYSGTDDMQMNIETPADTQAVARLRDLLHAARVLGEQERDARNARDGRTATTD